MCVSCEAANDKRCKTNMSTFMLCHNNKMYEIWSYLHKDYYYKKMKRILFLFITKKYILKMQDEIQEN